MIQNSARTDWLLRTLLREFYDADFSEIDRSKS